MNVSKVWRPRSKTMRLGIFVATVFVLSGIGFGQALAKFWEDPATGLAIAGYDPVAYYTAGKERLGDAAYEVAWKGQFWRFANEGNKAAFIQAPNVYAPQFNGYGMVSVSRGLPAAGNPHIWAVHENLLYLFHSIALRAIWLDNADQILGEAQRRWPEVERSTEQ